MAYPAADIDLAALTLFSELTSTELDAITWMEPMNEVMSKITSQTTTDLI